MKGDGRDGREKDKERRRRAYLREHPDVAARLEAKKRPAGYALDDLDEFIRKTNPIRSRLWRGRRKYGTVAASVAAVVLAVLLTNSAVLPGGLPRHPVAKPTSDFIGGTLIQGPLFFQPKWNDCTKDYRPDYGLSCPQQTALFGNLSFLKADTYDIANATYQSFIRGGSYDIASVGPAYWAQPEFFPSWQASWPAKFLMPSNYSTPRGYGVYPWVHGWQVCAGADPNDVSITLTMTDLLHTAWNVSYWQAFGLYAFFPSAAYNLNGTVHFSQDPAYASQHVAPALDLPGYGTNGNDSLYAALTDPSSPQYNASTLPTSFPADSVAGTRHSVVMQPVNNPVVTGFRPGWVIPLQMTLRISGAKVGDNFVVDLWSVNWDDTMVGPGSPYFYTYGRYILTDGDTYGQPLNQYVVEVRSC